MKKDDPKVIFRIHALKRMVERNISPEDLSLVLNTGTCIESYPDDQPFPSRLLMGTVGNRTIHAVVADDRLEGKTIIITAYDPDPEKWEAGFSRRRRS